MSKAYDDFMRLARGLRAMKFDYTKKSSGYSGHDSSGAVLEDDVDLDVSNLCTSRVRGLDKNADMLHRVVLDIDMEAALIPSSTPGHYHLILDHNIPWPKYIKLLAALADAGIIQKGYYAAAVTNGYTAIRPPWIKKDKKAA